MVEYERCPHCKKVLELNVEIKDGGDYGKSILELTEYNIKNARDRLIESGLVNKEVFS